MNGIQERLMFESAPNAIALIGIEQKEVTIKLCGCGCGMPVKICKRNDPRKGYIKGEPRRFLAWHQYRGRHPKNWAGGRKLDSDGYVLLSRPNHHRAQACGYVQEHVVIVEEILGMLLPKKAIIHHANEKRSDNRPENLVVCQGMSYHKLLHRRMRALRACGHADWRRCVHCKKYDDSRNMYINGSKAQHRGCHAEYERKRKHDNT